MIEFNILKKSKKSQARLGLLKTSNGEIETPAFVAVATQASVRTLSSEEIKDTKTQILIANTFHLHLRPGEQLIKKINGLHRFMNWPGPLMTDSGGFQVFSLGFGREYGISKVLKKQEINLISKNNQSNLVKITEQGVFFRSPIDGRKIFLGPRESIKIQEALGADIIFAFDECPPPLADYKYIKKSLELTHRWAQISLKTKKSNQALFGIIQGGKFKDLRLKSANFIAGLEFDGFGIGGEFGSDKKTMTKMLQIINSKLPSQKPRHLLGIGYPEDMLKIITAGVDTFDCTVPTHYGRHGIAFTSEGKLDLSQSKFLSSTNFRPLDKKCDCSVCRNYSRAYLAHLIRAKEISGLKFLSFHNLYFFNTLVEKIRENIKNGKI